MRHAAALASHLRSLGIGKGDVVVTTDKNLSGGEETVRLIREGGGKALFIQCNVSIEEEVEALISKTVETFGRLDFAFNNASDDQPWTRRRYCQ